MKLTGNTILVTGGGSGIGQALAWRFHALGNAVIVAGRTAASLDATVAGRDGMSALELDVRDPASIQRAAAQLASEHPQLNVLIQSAGIMRYPEEPAHADELVEINLLGTIRTIEALLPQLRGQPDPVVMTVSSGLAFVPLARAQVYSATKAAVHSYTVSLREKLRGEVEVIEIAPPAVQTGLTPGQETREGYLPLGEYIEQTMALFEQVPTPEENLVPNARFLRDAEKEGRLPQALAMLGSL